MFKEEGKISKKGNKKVISKIGWFFLEEPIKSCNKAKSITPTTDFIKEEKTILNSNKENNKLIVNHNESFLYY